MLTYLMVARVAQLCPGAVLTKLDKLVEPLKMTVTTKVKANAVKQVCNTDASSPPPAPPRISFTLSKQLTIVQFMKLV